MFTLLEYYAYSSAHADSGLDTFNADVGEGRRPKGKGHSAQLSARKEMKTKAKK